MCWVRRGIEQRLHVDTFMKKLFRVVQFGANFGIIVLAILFAFVVIHQYVIAPDLPEQNRSLIPGGASPIASTKPQENLIGKTLPLRGINWKDNGKTLILYLSTTCGYCNASVPFYQRIENEKEATIKTVAVFWQREDEAQKYLESHKIKADKILSVSLSDIGISGTPTILIVDENGLISDLWLGKLDANKEAEVLTKLTS